MARCRAHVSFGLVANGLAGIGMMVNALFVTKAAVVRSKRSVGMILCRCGVCGKRARRKSGSDLVG